MIQVDWDTYKFHTAYKADEKDMLPLTETYKIYANDEIFSEGVKSSIIKIADGDIASEANLKFVVCAEFENKTICNEKIAKSSKKEFWVQANAFEYPVWEKPGKAILELGNIAVLRENFNNRNNYDTLRVNFKPDVKVKIALEGSSSSELTLKHGIKKTYLSLDKSDNYRKFLENLQDSLKLKKVTHVKFIVEFDYYGKSHFYLFKKEYKNKSKESQISEVKTIADAAIIKIANKHAYWSSDDHSYSVDKIEYDKFTQRYRFDFRGSWTSVKNIVNLRREKVWVSGCLSAKSNGSDAIFEIKDNSGNLKVDKTFNAKEYLGLEIDTDL